MERYIKLSDLVAHARELRFQSEEQLLDLFDGLPSAEPERKTGKWGKEGECQFCGYLRQWKDDKFCANCGAKMEA